MTVNNSTFFKLEVEREPFLHLLNECRKADKYIDVELQIGDKLFPAHRVVLALSSPVLKALISVQWSTTNICSLSEEYVDVEIVEDLLSYFYTGSIKLSPDNVHPVCMAAHFLQIPTLLEQSARYLCQYITIENVLTLFKFSTACEIEELNYSCLRFVNKYHESVFQNSEIPKFSFKNFKDLIVGLKKIWAKMLRENTFHCILRWVRENYSERLDELPVLLKNIPLEELSLEFLTETVSKHSLVKNTTSCNEAVSDALANYHTYANPALQARQMMVVICGQKAGSSCTQQSMCCTNSRIDFWKDLPELPSYRSQFGVTVVDQLNIVVCGGYVDREQLIATASVVMFEWFTKTWIYLPSMPVASPFISIAMCKDSLYAIGRFSSESLYSSRVLQYSFETKTWSFVASMNRERLRGRLVEYKDYLYVFGGWEDTVERYDPAQNEWTIVANMEDKDVDVQVTVHQDKIYLLRRVDLVVFDPETNHWSSLKASPFRSGSSLVSLDGKLLAVGGNHVSINKKQPKSNQIYEFDFPTEVWKDFGNLNDELAYHSTVVGLFF